MKGKSGLRCDAINLMIVHDIRLDSDRSSGIYFFIDHFPFNNPFTECLKFHPRNIMAAALPSPFSPIIIYWKVAN